MSAPLPCPSGHYSDMPGQTECKKCNGSAACRSTVTPVWSRGQPHLGQRSRQLISCPPGTYRDGERSDCVVCPAGESVFQVGLVAFHIQYHILSVIIWFCRALLCCKYCDTVSGRNLWTKGGAAERKRLCYLSCRYLHCPTGVLMLNDLSIHFICGFIC